MNNFPPLVATKKEPEYKTDPLFLISSVGTDYTTANETNLPAGSALMTDTLDGKGGGSSVLNSKGITHIIHAAPKPRSSFSTDQDFINNVVKAVQNCILLADRVDIQQQIKTDTLAICLVGGGISILTILVYFPKKEFEGKEIIGKGCLELRVRGKKNYYNFSGKPRNFLNIFSIFPICSLFNSPPFFFADKQLRLV